MNQSTIQPEKFREVFEYFKEAVKQSPRNGGAFTGFRSGPAYEWEQRYKVWLYHEAGRLLEAAKWKRSWIGSGRILSRMIAAIQIKVDKEYRNNIVEWEPRRGPQNVSHAKLLAVADSPETLEKLEGLLYRLYVDQDDPAELFGSLVEIVGARYDLLSYMFFLRDWTTFMPARSSIFPEGFDRLGIPHAMSMKCSWENYQGFLSRLVEVQRNLDAQGIPGGVTLLDAHSFCWMLATLPAPMLSVVPEATLIRFTPEAGDPPSRNHSVNGFSLTELDLVLEKQRQIGGAAQDVVLRAERKRLQAAGRLDLAERTNDVSDNTALGYDIKSFFDDGRAKYIEVKAAAFRGDDVRFFLSRTELDKSKTLDGYVFALVTGLGGSDPVILEFSGPSLPADSLHPEQFEARLKMPKNKSKLP